LQKGNKMNQNSTKTTKGSTGEVMPKSASKADTKNERHEKMKGGVAMGKEDGLGKDSQFNTGRTSGICYSHERDTGKDW
jgi:hypothetical protein